MAKWQEIANIDIREFNSLNRAELAKKTSQLASVANKRMTRMEKSGIESPAYKSAQKYLGKEDAPKRFSVRGKGINELRAEFIRLKQFLESKTSTLKGHKEVRKEFYKRLGVPEGEEMSEDDESEFWDAYNELEPYISQLIRYENKQGFFYSVWSENKGKSYDELKNLIKEELDKMETPTDEISDLFEIQ